MSMTLRYKMKHKMEQHPNFGSGLWVGFYIQNGVTYKMECRLSFKNLLINGEGQDTVGRFMWEGEYDLKRETCRMMKKYVGKHSVLYNGYVDENGIWGKWSIITFASGGFHIWPKDNKKEENIAK